MLKILSYDVLPNALRKAFFTALHDMVGRAWLAGGWVRDYVMEKQSNDIDIVVDVSALGLCQRIVRTLGYGTIVPLGEGEEEACRLVIGGEFVDISSFRLGAQSIEEDLRLRDFTCNAMAFSLEENRVFDTILIDPCGGSKDISKRVLRSLPSAFANDSLRILRAYRFRALYGFSLTAETRSIIKENSSGLKGVAAERKSYELSKIVASPCGEEVLLEMDEDGVLVQLLPELMATKGLKQPAAHHLDVWGHSFAAYGNMLSLVGNYQKHLVEHDLFVCELPPLLEEEKMWLSWSALLHDIGKAPCAATHPKDGRPTFYHHDNVGSKMVRVIGRRLRWSKTMENNIALLVELHMYPFHLCSSQDVRKLSAKAALKLYRKAGHLLVPLFYMALADSLASLGEGKPVDMERQLQYLYLRVQDVYKEHIEPMDSGPRLVTGHEIMELCCLKPGPQVKAILKKIEELQVEGVLQTEDDAMSWLKKLSLDLSKCP